MTLKDYRVEGKKKIRLSDYPTGAGKAKEKKESYIAKTGENLKIMGDLQDKLYSQGKEGLIIIFQAMDAAGKDSTIKHVMTGMNPQGVVVHSFKAPSNRELSHDYLWRTVLALPARGYMAIFNRSYYEDVLVVKVRKLYKDYNMAKRCLQDDIIEQRYRQICNFEKYLYQNSYRVIKLFLHVPKEKQKERFLERIDLKIKNWKFSASDVKERKLWDQYQKAYTDAINATATENCPWYVIPADNKWYTRYLVSEVILDVMKDMDPQYPVMAKQDRDRLATEREFLMNEED